MDSKTFSRKVRENLEVFPTDLSTAKIDIMISEIIINLSAMERIWDAKGRKNLSPKDRKAILSLANQMQEVISYAKKE